jgi:hypothetical protein
VPHGGDEFVLLGAPIDGSRGVRYLVDWLPSMPPMTVPVMGRAGCNRSYKEHRLDLDLALCRADAALYRDNTSLQDVGRGP